MQIITNLRSEIDPCPLAYHGWINRTGITLELEMQNIKLTLDPLNQNFYLVKIPRIVYMHFKLWKALD